MALDTAVKRAAHLLALPLPDGTIHPADRFTILQLFPAGLLAPTVIKEMSLNATAVTSQEATAALTANASAGFSATAVDSALIALSLNLGASYAGSAAQSAAISRVLNMALAGSAAGASAANLWLFIEIVAAGQAAAQQTMNLTIVPMVLEPRLIINSHSERLIVYKGPERTIRPQPQPTD